MNKAEQFFYEHAAFSFDLRIETREEGRMRSAQRLAAAERWARAQGVTFSWADDWEVCAHVVEYDGYVREPDTCEFCTLLDADGNVLASLGCIDDADDNYRRVIEAELAADAMHAHDA